MDGLHSKLVCVSKPVKVTENNKDTSLLPIKFDNSKLEMFSFSKKLFEN